MQWTVKEAAAFLQVPEDRVYEWIRDRKLPATKFSGRYHFNRLKLIDWAHENQVPLFVQNGSDLPSLREALRTGGVHQAIPGMDKPEVFKAIVEELPLPPEVEKDLLYQMILSREREGSTGIGRGIAIPHARHPLLLRVGKPFVSLCYLKNAMDFRAPDGEKVSVIFLIVTPNIRMHLHFLERLGHALRDPEFSRLVLSRAPVDKILAQLDNIERSIPLKAQPLQGT